MSSLKNDSENRDQGDPDVDYTGYDSNDSSQTGSFNLREVSSVDTSSPSRPAEHPLVK